MEWDSAVHLPAFASTYVGFVVGLTFTTLSLCAVMRGPVFLKLLRLNHRPEVRNTDCNLWFVGILAYGLALFVPIFVFIEGVNPATDTLIKSQIIQDAAVWGIYAGAFLSAGLIFWIDCKDLDQKSK